MKLLLQSINTKVFFIESTPIISRDCLIRSFVKLSLESRIHHASLGSLLFFYLTATFHVKSVEALASINKYKGFFLRKYTNNEQIMKIFAY